MRRSTLAGRLFPGDQPWYANCTFDPAVPWRDEFVPEYVIWFEALGMGDVERVGGDPLGDVEHRAGLVHAVLGT